MKKDSLCYLTTGQLDEEWGITVSTVGYQFIPPLSKYPLSQHPDSHNFSPQSGRVLKEYQLVYITKGEGFFESGSCRKQCVKAGTMILLFPDEWHSYYPCRETGWDEYWVGFKGIHIDNRVKKNFFIREEPLYKIGLSATIVSLYEDIMKFAAQEKAGYQQMISSIALHILGIVYYKARNNAFSNTYVADKVNEARILMKSRIESPSKPEDIAKQLGLGYSWFRRIFKEYTGISPAQYQLQQRLLKAKDLLANTQMNISEIAYALRFENVGQFSTFFKKREGVTPSEFRERGC
ncbi:MAG: AraC family transcriptional regulator [Tannerellaceae bacterium]|jgi:AraC-like DNA-binding protein|nr:AraC family transcriptional regulator [Tannerellaceae bacterium]